VARNLPRVLTDEECRRLLASPNVRYPLNVRNKAIMRVMLDAGLRISEALALGLGDVDWISGRLDVRHGKGDKDRRLYINLSGLEDMLAWREIRPSTTIPELFITRGGTRIHTSYARQMVKRYGRHALDRDIHPHMLRHSFATRLLAQTKNVELVRRALGHASIQTTQRYLHLADSEIEEAMLSLRLEEE